MGEKVFKPWFGGVTDEAVVTAKLEQLEKVRAAQLGSSHLPELELLLPVSASSQQMHTSCSICRACCRVSSAKVS